MDIIEVLYLSYDGMTDSLGKSQVLPYLVGLSTKGFRITLISFEKNNLLKKHKSQIEIITKNSDINWIPLIYTSKPPILSTLWDIFRLKKTVRRLFKQNNFKIVHCRSYITALVGLWVKKKFDTRFLFDMRGFWVDERVEGNIWNLKNPIFSAIYKYFKRKELTLLTNADYIISLTELAKDEIKSWEKFKNIDLKIAVIPCCADLKLFSKANIKQNQLKSLRERLKIPENSFILSYVGSIGTWYLMKEMFDFFKLLLEQKKESHFLIITHDNKTNIWNYVNDLAINSHNITVVSADRTEVPYYIALSDYSIFFIKQVYSKKASSPTKLGEIMGIGIPIICNSGIGDVDAIVNNSNCGFLINNFTENEYLQVIDKIVHHFKFDEKDIINGADNYFSLDKGIEKYYATYKELLY